EITGRHAGSVRRDGRPSRREAQRTAGLQTPSCDTARPGESATGASARGAQCPGAHEPLPFRATLQAKHGRAAASLSDSAPDRRGARLTGGSNGPDRLGRAVGVISVAELRHVAVASY